MRKDNSNSPATAIRLGRHKPINSAKALLAITIGLFVLLYVLCILLFQDQNFAKYSVFFNFFNNKAYLLVLSLGLTIVMIVSSIDIYVRDVTGLVSMVVAVMLTEHGRSAVSTIPVSVAIGLAFGVVQGFIMA